MERRNKLYTLLLIMMLGSAMALSACGSGSSSSSGSEGNTPAPPASGSSEATSPTDGKAASPDEAAIDWAARKKLNAAAGQINYITGYYYAASPPDIQVIMAKELGYFEEMGLDVHIMPGLDSEGMKFLAAGQAQIASAGTPSLVIQSVANGAAIKGVATFGATGVSALMVMNDSGISKPQDLVGKTIGYHGALPANIQAMLKQSNIDPTSVKGVSVGYDPTVLSSGKVDALTVYKSNEPYMMEKMGLDVALIDPGQFGAETSFGVLAVNNAFAEANPTTVEDFLRAVSKAHSYAASNIDASLKVLASLSDSLYDLPTEMNRWTVESGLVEQAKLPGHGVAWQSDEQWLREIEMLSAAGIIKEQMPVDNVMNNAFIHSIYNGEALIWPQP